jgi:hypothetical protein
MASVVLPYLFERGWITLAARELAVQSIGERHQALFFLQLDFDASS